MVDSSSHTSVVNIVIPSKTIHTMTARPKRFALSRLSMFLRYRNPSIAQIVNKKYVSDASSPAPSSAGISRNMPNASIIIKPAAPKPFSALSPLIPASLYADAETNPYTIVAPNVVTSTIHPTAVLPINGMNRETAAMNMIARDGTPSLLRAENEAGSTESFDSTYRRRLSATTFPMRLETIRQRSAAMSMRTPLSPR